MTGYPQGTGYPYATPANPYGGQPPTAHPYGSGAPTPSAPYGPGAPVGPKPPKENKYGSGSGGGIYGSSPQNPYGASAAGSPYGTAPPYGVTTPSPYGAAAAPYPSQGHPPYGAAAAPYPSQGQPPYGAAAAPYPSQGQPPYGAASPFASLLPSTFPPGTDPNIIACFQAADSDGSGFIDDRELQGALSSYRQAFSMRTVRLLMYLFTGTSVRRIGPKEFVSVFYSLQNWRAMFERYDRDMSGKIDAGELNEALRALGFTVSSAVLDLLILKFDKTGGTSRAIEYDNFIECCLTVKGLTEKFREKDIALSGSATFTYESFMLTVLPFLIA